MIFGVLLILVGCMFMAPQAGGGTSTLHLFASLVIIGLGAICCTVAHYLKAIRDELRLQDRMFRNQPAAQTEQRPQPATHAEREARDARWQRALESSRSRGLTDRKNT